MIRVFVGFLLLLTLGGSAFAQSCGTLTTLVNGTNADAGPVNGNFQTLLCLLNSINAPRGYISGLTLSTAGASSAFNVDVGFATSDDATTPMNLTASIGKNTNPWAVGPSNGALDTGAIQVSTWYHVFEIARVDTPTVDILISTNPTSPTLPTHYTKQRRIGSMKTDASAHWTAFTQIGDEFLWHANVTELSYAAIGNTTANTLTLGGVPTGVTARALMHLGLGATAGAAGALLVTALDESDIVPDSLGGSANTTLYASAGFVAGDLEKRTNTAAQIRYRTDLSSIKLAVFTFGWIDRRGRDN